MARTPNYSFERMQRERAQRAKAEEKAQKRAEKTALRKGVAPEQATDAEPGSKDSTPPPDKAAS